MIEARIPIPPQANPSPNPVGNSFEMSFSHALSLHQLATIGPSNCRRQPPGWTPGPHCLPHAVPHAVPPCPQLSKALAVSKTASITPRHDYNVPGTQVGKRQLNDVLYFPVGTTTQELPSSRVTKASGPRPRSVGLRSRCSSLPPSPASHLLLSSQPCSRAPLPGTLHPPPVPSRPSGLSACLWLASSEPTC